MSGNDLAVLRVKFMPQARGLIGQCLITYESDPDGQVMFHVPDAEILVRILPVEDLSLSNEFFFQVDDGFSIR